MRQHRVIGDVLRGAGELREKVALLVVSYPDLTYGDLLMAMGVELTEFTGRAVSFSQELEIVLQIGAQLGTEPDSLRHVRLSQLVL